MNLTKYGYTPDQEKNIALFAQEHGHTEARRHFNISPARLRYMLKAQGIALYATRPTGPTEDEKVVKISKVLDKMIGHTFEYMTFNRKILDYEFRGLEVWVHGQKKYKQDVHKMPISTALKELKHYRKLIEEKR